MAQLRLYGRREALVTLRGQLKSLLCTVFHVTASVIFGVTSFDVLFWIVITIFRSCSTIHLQNWQDRLLLWVMAQSLSTLHLYFLSSPVCVARLKKAWNAPNCDNLSPSLSCDTDLARVAADAPVVHVGHSQVSAHVTVIHRLKNWVKRKTSLKTSLHSMESECHNHK